MQIFVQVFNGLDIPPFMRHTRPDTGVIGHDFRILVTDYQSFSRRPDLVQRDAPSLITPCQIVITKFVFQMGYQRAMIGIIIETCFRSSIVSITLKSNNEESVFKERYYQRRIHVCPLSRFPRYCRENFSRDQWRSLTGPSDKMGRGSSTKCHCCRDSGPIWCPSIVHRVSVVQEYLNPTNFVVIKRY